ncbi:MAG: endonuclease Q family protein [Candidatus Zipacnadales bacterium]
MRTFVCDLHIHIGASTAGRPVKVTASRALTFENIALECTRRKGVEVAGIVDCASPRVMEDIYNLLSTGEMVELSGGGLRYRDQLTILPASEIETWEPSGGASHHISYFPGLEQLKAFASTLSRYVTNIELSSQTCRLPAAQLEAICHEAGGVLIPAHSFTPHKSVYGSCARRMTDIFPLAAWERIPAIELGLSADTFLADRIAELRDKTFLANSDAHSLPRIAREYNLLRMEQPTYDEFLKALRREDGRTVTANYGLDPRLGKYHRTRCEECNWIATHTPPVRYCEHCESERVTMGVLDRIVEIQDTAEPSPPSHRPPYHYQIPLQFVPKVGGVRLNRLINRFGSEMAVLHEASPHALAQTVGTTIAELIIRAREGTLMVQPGGGGRYGRALADVADGQLRLPGLGATPGQGS